MKRVSVLLLVMLTVFVWHAQAGQSYVAPQVKKATPHIYVPPSKPRPSKAQKAEYNRKGLRATATAHSTVLTWTGGTTGATFNVYKAPCTGFVAGTGTPNVGTCTTPGTFALLTSTPITPLTYTDTSVTGNATAVYYITSVCASGGGCPSNITTPSVSAPSDQVATLTPGDNPLPPTLTISTVAKVINQDNTQTVIAKWTDTNPVGQWFSFSDGNNFLAQGLIAPGPTTFAEEWTGPSTTSITFTATDAAGVSASQPAM